MAEKLDICFDLGSDSLKVTYCHKRGEQLTFGKIVEKDYLAPSTISSNAYYNEKEKQWSFGIKTEKINDPNLSSIVNVNKMLSLLIKPSYVKNTKKKDNDKISKEINEIFNSNKDYFFNRNYFPLYFFPESKKYDNKFDYKEKVFKKDVFEVRGYTPEMLCQDFFYFVKQLCDKVLKEIGCNMDYSLSVVYPLRAGKTFIDELKKLIETAFHKTVSTMICQTKALTILAKYQKKIKEKDEFLVFNIGNEDISVAKACYSNNGTITIDGKDGHNDSEKIGGVDIDEKVTEYLIDKNSTGSSIGGLQETMLQSKQYLLSLAIKQAKKVLSSEELLNNFPSQSVPIELYLDTIYTVDFSKEELMDLVGCIANKNKNSIADQIVDYMDKELSRLVNRNVSKVFISGGVIETAGLFEYLRNKLEKKFNVRLNTFENTSNRKGLYDINDDNDSVYASCMGANIITLNEIDIPVCLSLSYGTYGETTEGCYVLSPFKGADKGAKLYKDRSTEFAVNMSIYGSCAEEFFSYEFSDKELHEKAVPGLKFSNDEVVVYRPGTSDRENVAKKIGLKVVAGGAKGKIVLSYNGKKIMRLGFDAFNRQQKLSFSEGISVTPDGKARPFVRNQETSSINRVRIIYENGTVGEVLAKDVNIYFEGVDQFDASGDDE